MNFSKACIRIDFTNCTFPTFQKGPPAHRALPVSELELFSVNQGSEGEPLQTPPHREETLSTKKQPLEQLSLGEALWAIIQVRHIEMICTLELGVLLRFKHVHMYMFKYCIKT